MIEKRVNVMDCAARHFDAGVECLFLCIEAWKRRQQTWVNVDDPLWKSPHTAGLFCLVAPFWTSGPCPEGVPRGVVSVRSPSGRGARVRPCRSRAGQAPPGVVCQVAPRNSSREMASRVARSRCSDPPVHSCAWHDSGIRASPPCVDRRRRGYCEAWLNDRSLRPPSSNN